MFSSIITFLDVFGIIVFAVSGALAACRKHLDVFGVIVVALVASLGGGTIRDLILDVHPVVWIENTNYLIVGVISALVTFVLLRFFSMKMRMLEVFDAFGLAFFTIAGIQKSQYLGHSAEVALLMGVITGVAGGVLRDIICNDIPLIFHREIYALAALSGGVLYLFLEFAGLNIELSMLSGMAAILIIRISAVFRGLSMPPFLFSEEEPK